MLLVADEDRFRDHWSGPGHPESAERLIAVRAGLLRAGALESESALIAANHASVLEITRVHDQKYVDWIRDTARVGGGHIDADTSFARDSWEVATLAAGVGLAAVQRLRVGAGSAAFLAIRPPGHHAVARRGMGFCLLNNIAITAAAIREAGERVAIIDIDAHHGNGTQEIFAADPNTLFVSLHQSPGYPGTGAASEVGVGAGLGATMNIPLPPGTGGTTYRYAFDEVVRPAVDAFCPDWILVSAGFDAHRDDPLTDMGLTAGDYVAITRAIMDLVPKPGRLIVFLEGGYDLVALGNSVEAMASTLLGNPNGVELPSEVELNAPAVASAVEARQRALDQA